MCQFDQITQYYLKKKIVLIVQKIIKIIKFGNYFILYRTNDSHHSKIKVGFNELAFIVTALLFQLLV